MEAQEKWEAWIRLALKAIEVHSHVGPCEMYGVVVSGDHATKGFTLDTSDGAPEWLGEWRSKLGIVVLVDPRGNHRSIVEEWLISTFRQIDPDAEVNFICTGRHGGIIPESLATPWTQTIDPRLDLGALYPTPLDVERVPGSPPLNLQGLPTWLRAIMPQ